MTNRETRVLNPFLKHLYNHKFIFIAVLLFIVLVLIWLPSNPPPKNTGDNFIDFVRSYKRKPDFEERITKVDLTQKFFKQYPNIKSLSPDLIAYMEGYGLEFQDPWTGTAPNGSPYTYYRAEYDCGTVFFWYICRVKNYVLFSIENDTVKEVVLTNNSYCL